MARSITVLDWPDIRSLVAISTQSVGDASANRDFLEPVRHRLIEALLVYLREWFPGQEIDDETRIVLIRALKSFEETYSARARHIQHEATRQRVSQMVDEASRIRLLVHSALEKDSGQGDASGGGGWCPPIALIVVTQCLGLLSEWGQLWP